MDVGKDRPRVTAGLDLGDKYSHLCLIDSQSGEVVEEGRLRTSPDAFGGRLPKCPAGSFHKRAKEHIPEAHLPAIAPILQTIGSPTEHIRQYDRKLEAISKEHYPETELLRQVEGVGALTERSDGTPRVLYLCHRATQQPRDCPSAQTRPD